MTHDTKREYAWLTAPPMRDRPERTFFATWPKDAAPELARTSVTELIQGVYDHDPEMARKIVRARIFTTQPELTSMCKGMIDVAAKRASANAPLPDFTHATQVRGPAAAGFEFIDEPFQLENLKATRAESGPLYTRDRAVTVVLVKNGRVLARAKNTNATNRTLHAELNLVRGWTEARGPIPENVEIHITLQPCRMCAAQIARAARDLARLSVFYADADPGPAARGTVLEGIARQLP